MDIFNNKNVPFAVPEGYFDSLQTRIMSRVNASKRKTRVVRMFSNFRALIAAAACILLVYTGALKIHAYKQQDYTQTLIDEDFYRWMLSSEKAALFIQTLDLDLNLPSIFPETCEEDQAIISFLERDNISVAAILLSFDNIQW